MIDVITGRQGQGKTSLAYHLARREHPGVFVFDPTEAFGIGTKVYSAAELVAAGENGAQSPIVFVASGKLEEEISAFCLAVMNFQGVSVIVDEAALVSSPSWIPDDLDRLVRRSRRLELALYITAHRPQDLHGLFFSLAHYYQFFHTTNHNDVKKIREYTSDALSERVTQLAPHVFAQWSVATNDFFVNSDPRSWKVELDPKILTREAVDSGLTDDK